MKVKQGKVLHWFVEKPRVEEGSDLPPTGSCRNLSRFAGCTSNGIDHHNHDDEEDVFLHHSGCFDDNKNLKGYGYTLTSFKNCYKLHGLC